MKFKIITILFFLSVITFTAIVNAEVIEEVYAVINDEIITYSELRNAEVALRQEISKKYSGEEFTKIFTEQKKMLLERIMENKLILSKAKEKNYDVENDVGIWIKELKKEHNIKNDQDFKTALAQQGITLAQLKDQLRTQRMQSKLLYEEAYSNINIDNSQIMEYYRANIEEHTIPQKITLNCIFLNKANYVFENMLTEKRTKISNELKTGEFKQVAEIYSELSGTENKYTLGEFSKGELDNTLEQASLSLKPGEFSDWLETDTGWYIIQLIKLTETQLIDYKKVRDQIKEKLFNVEREKELKKYLVKIKKESYIKIYKQF